MAVATFSGSPLEAGPSTPRSPSKKASATAAPKSVKRVAEFNGSSDEEDATPNGSVSSVSRVHGKPHKKRKLVDKAEDGRQRKAEADRLFVTRQELPFYQGRVDILNEIMSHDTTIIVGETGCGKSTQLPQLLRTHPLSLDHFTSGGKAAKQKRGPRIAVTQPRRLPTIALAQRVSTEMGTLLGGEVGYSVRFDDCTSYSTKVKYMTEGVLMRELSNGDDGPSLLLDYDVVIVDEAHERTLNTDFICGSLKRIQTIRKEMVAKAKSAQVNGSGEANDKSKEREGTGVTELKIVIMSATLDPAKFSNFFETKREALLVKGRMYNVDTRHSQAPLDDFIEGACKTVFAIHLRPNSPGDVLVFMPGSEEIENCCESLRKAARDTPDGNLQMEVLPLYASLPPTAQSKIFSPVPKDTRRVIVATNIAETSITIAGVAFVVDTGYKKEKEYIFRSTGALEHLKRKEVSKAAARQRTGRAGRERSGECYRLFTEDKFRSLIEFDAPEIQRVNLASAVLTLASMRLDPFEFEYIDNPGRDPLGAAFTTLKGLGAIESPTSVTPLGRDMLKYPLDPEHARILIASFEHGCANEVIDILSLLNAGNVWVDRSGDRDHAATARQKFVNRDGDHLTALNVFRAWCELREQGSNRSNRETARWCKENHVNSRTLQQAVKIRDQLRSLAEHHQRDWRASNVDKVVQCLLQGLFMNTAVIQADGTYRQTAGNLQVKIHPSSVLMSKKVPAIVYDELAITTSIYARNVSSFDQAWLADIPLFRSANISLAQASTAKSSL